jgi:hypothetical protein
MANQFNVESGQLALPKGVTASCDPMHGYTVSLAEQEGSRMLMSYAAEWSRSSEETKFHAGGARRVFRWFRTNLVSNLSNL